ncbi:flagellar FliJ family protein [Helicobacter cetorum]|uniref:Uncharacterized protein n=1 Tax=Helicobacter cetorum (strain ATCC BAA-540 / CCUG 52418 / MIT 99-5656) TaxID=1163745 RepID=I0ERG3_HELCM|nr:flagellar FliJ family protein [Helicobacter cetorum]AFI05532.1 hypothetical protein HCD_02570 [Helicobacter cetorum MIT 99-5656]
MKKFASVLVSLRTLALEKIEQKLNYKRLEIEQNTKQLLERQMDLNAFKNPEFGGIGMFLQTQHLKSTLRVEISSIETEAKHLNDDLKALEKDYLFAHQELEKAKMILENEKKKEIKILEKKEQALLDENAIILHWQKESLYA